MSRRQADIILSCADAKRKLEHQILKAKAIFAVFLDDQPISLRTDREYPKEPRYRRVAFSNPGHCFNMCEKLNSLFKTDRFSVHMLSNGRKVTEDYFR